jgi:prepilin-type N-terminal cleavage/methylation domain-containing protein
MVMSMQTKHGFTLIEVLVASLVIMLGVTGYTTLQSQYVLADNELNLRYLAMQLAQQKVDDLAYFEHLDPQPSKFAYADIQSNQGGTIVAGPVNIQLSINITNTHLFHINWQVVDLFYVDTDADMQADRWVKFGEPFYPKLIPRVADLKTANIEVSWLNNKGETKNIGLLTHIAPILPSNSFQTKYRTTSVSASP